MSTNIVQGPTFRIEPDEFVGFHLHPVAEEQITVSSGTVRVVIVNQRGITPDSEPESQVFTVDSRGHVSDEYGPEHVVPGKVFKIPPMMLHYIEKSRGTYDCTQIDVAFTNVSSLQDVLQINANDLIAELSQIDSPVLPAERFTTC